MQLWFGSSFPKRRRNNIISITEYCEKSLCRSAEAFLESCVALPVTDSVIDRIIYEELDAMFAGDKTPEETCDVIQNRVWIYVKESE